MADKPELAEGGIIPFEIFDNLLERDYEGANCSPKLFLTKEEIEYLVKAGYPANMFVCLPKQAGIKEEEE
jgi:hypothetical protein